MKEDKEFLRDLVNSISPSGNESGAIEIWESYMQKTGATHEFTDKMLNSSWKIGHGPVDIMLSAHIDSVTAKVSYITDDGYLCIVYDAGPDRNAFMCNSVYVISDEKPNPIVGVVVTKPLHLRHDSDDESKRYNDFSDFRIDIGATSREEAEKMGVYTGCDVIYPRNCIIDFGNTKVCAPDLDDKAGIYVVARIISELQSSENKSWEDAYTIHAVATTQEEVGLRGATVSARRINPAISLDYDVTFATDGDCGVSKEKVGDVKLGHGAVIVYGADKSRRISSILKTVCKLEEIPYQTASESTGGTNTDAIQLNSSDCETMLISLPNISMHTPVEVCDWRDFDSAVRMTLKLIQDQLL